MSDSVLYLLKFCLGFFLIFFLIFIITLLTPKIAAKVDKIADKIIKPKSGSSDDGQYKVRSIYDLPEDKNNKKNNDTGEVKNGEE